MHHLLPHRVALRRGALAPLLVTLVICAPGMAMGQASPFLTGASSLQTNILILRCSGSESGGTSQFASRLIGEREVLRRQISHGKDRESVWSSRGARRSRSVTVQHVTETAVMASELEQLPDLCGYLKCASSAVWLKVAFAKPYARGGSHGCS
jgi:Type IV secretion-system coupling protein DNA-binding domain